MEELGEERMKSVDIGRTLSLRLTFVYQIFLSQDLKCYFKHKLVHQAGFKDGRERQNRLGLTSKAKAHRKC